MEYRPCYGFVIMLSLFIPFQTQRAASITKIISLATLATAITATCYHGHQQENIMISNTIPTCPYGEPLINKNCSLGHHCPCGHECNTFTERCCPSDPDDICDRGQLRKGKCGPKDYPCPCGEQCRIHPAKGHVVCCPSDYCQERECKNGYPLENQVCGYGQVNDCPTGYDCNNNRCCPVKIMPGQCKYGSQLENQVCGYDEVNSCPTGYECNNYRCCPIQIMPEECEYGNPLENRPCEFGGAGACPTGYECNNTRCCPDPPCSSIVADIVFVIDESGSIGTTDFPKVIKMVEDMVKSFDIAIDKVKVGVLTFHQAPTVEFHLDAYDNKADVLNALASIIYSGGFTNTFLALDSVVDEMFAAGNGNRPNVEDIAIVLTDGHSGSGSVTLTAAQRLHNAGILVFGVGIGSSVGESELNAIASDPDSTYSIRSPNFDSLANVTQIIQEIICPGP